MMPFLKKILAKFDGLHYRQEYLCLGEESFTDPLHAYLTDGKKTLKDITKLHCFVGYHPLIFAMNATDTGGRSEIEIVFAQQSLPLNEVPADRRIVARLGLKKIVDHRQIAFFEGVKARHDFINPVSQKVGGFINRYFNRKPGNVFLDNDLYKQVQVAYSIPRKISLITAGRGEFFNHFPTDLHGQIDDNTYIISLRHEGFACKQVMEARRIVLCDMKASAYKTVYSLGKNHMQPLRSPDHFPFSPAHSTHFGLPLAQEATSYKELELEYNFNHGIHRIMVFRIVHQALVSYFGPDPAMWLNESPAETLAHIHNVYATWRYKKGLQSNYLLR